MVDDNQAVFEILLKYTRDETSAKAALADLSEAQKAGAKLTETTIEGSKAAKLLEENERAAHLALEKFGVAGREASVLLRGLFSPLSLAVVGIGAAIEIMNRRFEESVKILSGLDLPQLSSDFVAATDVMKSYTDALDAVVEKYNSIEEASGRVITKIQEELKIRQELNKVHGAPEIANVDADIKAREAELAEKEKRITELQVSSAEKKRLAEQIHAPSEAAEARYMDDAKAQADAAKKAFAESNQRTELIQKIRDATIPNPADLKKYADLYGGSTRGSEALAIEEANQQQAQSIITRYDKLLAGEATRKQLMEKRKRLLDEAGKEAGEAETLWHDVMAGRQALPGQFAAGLEKALGAGTPGGAASLIQKYLESLKQLSSGHGTAADDQLRQHVAELLASTKQADQQTFALLQQLISHKGDLNSALKSLSDELDSVASRTDRRYQ